MDAANIPSNLGNVTPGAAGAGATTSTTSIISPEIPQIEQTATVAVPQGQVQADLAQTDQGAAGPTVQLKIAIEQTIVQLLSQLETLLDRPQTLADFLPESVRQDMEQILSDKLFAATPDVLEQGLTAMVKTNKDTADAFSQLTKGLNLAISLQQDLPESVQKILLTVQPLMTELLQQTQSELEQASGQTTVLNSATLGEPSVVVQGQPSSVLSAAETEVNTSVNSNFAASGAQNTTPQVGQTTQNMPLAAASASQQGVEQTVLGNQSSTPATGNLVGQEAKAIASLPANSSASAMLSEEEMSGVENDQSMKNGNGVSTSDQASPTAQSASLDRTEQAAIPTSLGVVLSMINHPQVPDNFVGVDEFFNWIAQQFMQNQDNPSLQDSLTQKLDQWKQPLQQLSDQDSQAFNEIKNQLEQQLPSQVKQLAEQFPAIKDLYIYKRLSDVAKYTTQNQAELNSAKNSMNNLAESFQKLLVTSQSFHSETGNTGKVFTMFMPIAFDGTTVFPAHIHIYHQKQPESRGKPAIAETWLRIFLKTDYSGTVTVFFHVRQQAVEVKVGFSDKQAAGDFYEWLPSIRQSIASSPFTLQNLQILSA